VKENILGFDVDKASQDELVDKLFQDISSMSDSHSHSKWLACLNAHSYAVSRHDSIYLQALKNADLLIPDGSGIVMASRVLGGKIVERITGFDIFFGLHTIANHKGNISVFFLGSTEKNLDMIASQIAKDFPNINVVGTYSPPFKDEFSDDEVNKMIAVINASEADILWVGMTAPKQEKFIFKNINKLNIKFAGAVGAVFDFYTGNVKRSPLIIQRLGLESLHRLVKQPKKNWRRVFVSIPIFLWCLFIKFLKNEK
jgi:N-acetylglucosaminyldiphosphoundecaprenol N-acetyl-beta-D-mannosaminyltransferase